MTRFALAVHCHQPVGNFPWVFEEAYETAYRPFLETLERHPRIRLGLHYSGSLLDWFKSQHPEFLGRVKRLVRREQVELLGGGYFEPILTMIPERDALGQIQRMDQTLRRWGLNGKEGQRASGQGIWLPERVWEPHLPSLLNRAGPPAGQAGIRYTIVDDHHFAQAGIPEENRFGYYLTEDRGASLALFPSSKRLRYLVPFKPVEEVLETLRELRSESPRVVVLADDGEKFGLWPGTHSWVYQEGWLEAFFQRLEENEAWLKLMTFRDVLNLLPPLGRIYVPCSSYEEMDSWSGGFFRNFLVRYPEANTMHKKMLWISDRLERAGSRGKASGARAQAVEEARWHLYRAQSNDAYWHGVFGGLYLRHLRRGVYQNLLKAEQALDRLENKGRRWASYEAADLSGDGVRGLLLRSRSLTVALDPDRGGQSVELSDKETGINLLDTLTRRPEPYHQKIRLAEGVTSSLASVQKCPAASGTASGAKGRAPLSIHDERGPQVDELADALVYDAYRRAGWIDHGMPLDASVQALAQGEVKEMGDFLEGPYQWQMKRTALGLQAVLSRVGKIRCDGTLCPLKITKTIGIAAELRLLKGAYQLINRSTHRLAFLFGSELNLNLKDAHVNRMGEAQGVKRFSVTDPAFRLEVSWKFDREARLWYFPIETVSDSERGMERTYQGVSLTFLWPITLSPGGSWKVHWEMAIDGTS